MRPGDHRAVAATQVPPQSLQLGGGGDGHGWPRLSCERAGQARRSGRRARAVQDPLCCRHEELDRLARERDLALAAVRDAQAEQLQALEAGARELQARCEALEAQLRAAAGRQADVAREKDALIERLREDALALKSGWDAQVAQLSQEMVSKDLQAQALREEAASLRAQLAGSQQDVARYRQQLALAAGREQSLQRDKAQLELDWQRRCDGVERDLHLRAEDLVQALSLARDQHPTRPEGSSQPWQEKGQGPPCPVRCPHMGHPCGEQLGKRPPPSTVASGLADAGFSR
ncbi:PREDICTED: coiled-coil domain-containing protein 57 [Condylura cristata]|uniref:coiled-coil domain-containing protein 57 n=1 Tax=Condylura cristata TaxID=143302 RepID=UPI000642E992|nr:PREDICTED: coiled-coil domain-containing protein 57 [Condylura cristata]